MMLIQPWTRLALFSLLLSVVLMVLSLVVGQLAQAHEEIVFSVNLRGFQRILVMDVARRLSVNLDKKNVNNSLPVWSPDGEKIAFTAFWGMNAEVYVMNADGSGERNLSYHQAFDVEPIWSPDSQRIAFLSQRRGDTQLFVINADGTQLANLFDRPAYSMAWSPNGRYMAFSDVTAFYVYDFDHATFVEKDKLVTSQFVWMPDSERLLFALNRPPLEIDPNSLMGVMAMNPDGSEVVSFFDTGDFVSSLSLSPDGRRFVVLTGCRSLGCGAMYILNSDGSERHQLELGCASSNRVNLHSSSWSPDSQRVLFVSDCDGNGFDIYTVRPDGSDLQRLTYYDSDDNLNPSWRPAKKF